MDTIGEERKDSINEELLKEVRQNGGRLRLDFGNPLHYKHILNFLGSENNKNSWNDLQKASGSELLKAVEKQRERDRLPKEKPLGIAKTGTEDIPPVDENTNQFYIMAPGCKKGGLSKKLMKADKTAAADTSVIMQTMVSYRKLQAGIATEIKMRDKDTGELISTEYAKAKDCKELMAAIHGDYDKFKGEKEKHVFGIGTVFLVGENENRETVCKAEVAVTNEYSIMGDDDLVQEFKVIDPVIKRSNPPENKIIVSYKRDTIVKEFDYSIENEPKNNRITLMLPVAFSVTSKEDVTIVDLDRDRGFRLYFDNPYGGQNHYSNSLDKADIKFETIDGKVRKMTVILPENWATVLDFSQLENKINVDMKIYGEFNILVSWMGIEMSVSVSFRTDTSSSFEDVRNKLVPPIFMQWGCIGRGTRIKRINTQTGEIEEVKAEKLNINDTVLSINRRAAVIRNIVTGKDSFIWKIRTKEHEIRLSSTHSVRTGRGWLPVSELRSDDLICTEEGYEKLLSFDYVKYGAEVYNFIFKEETPMFGNGILIGDFMMQQRIRAFNNENAHFSEKTRIAAEELMSLLP